MYFRSCYSMMWYRLPHHVQIPFRFQQWFESVDSFAGNQWIPFTRSWFTDDLGRTVKWMNLFRNRFSTDSSCEIDSFIPEDPSDADRQVRLARWQKKLMKWKQELHSFDPSGSGLQTPGLKVRASFLAEESWSELEVDRRWAGPPGVCLVGDRCSKSAC